MTAAYKPLAMGVLMGLMVLSMLHGQIENGSDASPTGPIIFVGAHLALGLILWALTAYAARLSPRIQSWLTRLHRPTARHFLYMLGGALSAAVAVHLAIHGLSI